MFLQVWNIAYQTVLHLFEGHSDTIYCLTFSRDSHHIISGSADHTARLWDMGSSTRAHQTMSILEPDTTADAEVSSACISADCSHMATGSTDGIVRVWDLTTASIIGRLQGHSDSVYSVAFTPEDHGLISGGLDKTVTYWNLGPLSNLDALGCATLNPQELTSSNDGATKSPNGVLLTEHEVRTCVLLWSEYV